MKRTAFLLLLTLALPVSVAQLYAQTPASAAAQNAAVELIMDQYFAAMVNGDVETLKMLMAGDLLEKRAQLMDNPDYPAHLAETYMNATFAILGVTDNGPSTVSVDALITFGQDETIAKRYVLEASPATTSSALYRIISEQSQSE